MTLQANRSTHVRVDGREYLYFGGTNYLGLAQRTELMQAIAAAFDQFGVSSGASRLTSGENDILLRLEEEFAAFADAQKALVLPAGFMANQAAVNGLDDRVDAWLIRPNAHASIHAALKQSSKKVLTDNGFRRRDAGYGRLGIFAEPIDALTGELLDLNALMEQADTGDYVILDEAHSMGVLGERGTGAKELFALNGKNLVRTGTFSKALGAYGGFVLAETSIVDEIRSKSSAFRGSTSLPPLMCAASQAALRILRDNSAGTVVALRRNIALMNELLQGVLGDRVQPSKTPIFCLPDLPAVASARESLLEHGIFVPAMTAYFAGAGTVGLRFTIQAGHKEQDLRKLASMFKLPVV